MAVDEIAPDLRRFLRESVHSYEHLELLLFGREGRRLTVDLVAAKLKISISAAVEALEHLCDRGLLSREPASDTTYRFRPATPELAKLVDDMAVAYDDQRLALVKLMNEHAVERVRTAAMRIFADSFVLGKKRGRDG
jgi:DNA-binding IclR family transcriptional regulator